MKCNKTVSIATPPCRTFWTDPFGGLMNFYIVTPKGLHRQKTPSSRLPSYVQRASALIGETRAGTSKYYHADALGTTRAITSSS